MDSEGTTVTITLLNIVGIIALIVLGILFIRKKFWRYIYQKLVVINYCLLLLVVISRLIQEILINGTSPDQTDGLFYGCSIFKMTEMLGVLFGSASDMVIAYTFFQVQYKSINLKQFDLRHTLYIAVPLAIVQFILWLMILVSGNGYSVSTVFCLTTPNTPQLRQLFSAALALAFSGPFFGTVIVLIASAVLQKQTKDLTKETESRFNRKRTHLLWLCVSFLCTHSFYMFMTIYFPFDYTKRNLVMISIFIANTQPITHMIVNFVFLHYLPPVKKEKSESTTEQ